MTWKAPDIDRREPPLVGDERTQLQAYLDYHRDTLLWKCSGLSAEQLALRILPTSNLTLLGLVRHMTEVERGWFRRTAAGKDVGYVHDYDNDVDADFNALEIADGARDYARFRDEIIKCDAAVKDLALDHTFPHPRPDRTEPYSLRWVYLHMIEEYARHNGHADLLREAIDGATGE
ncbi:DinB family protein [Nocardia sp. XZ_19_385]|uniref:DinB family protein n=1 Tax=Nocardia sp. XZ_19_385 TaxID=2769488 RepID=UPI00188FAF51|nr:DinB family protein [Nocardia sp. XZ_19_385]